MGSAFYNSIALTAVPATKFILEMTPIQYSGSVSGTKPATNSGLDDGEKKINLILRHRFLQDWNLEGFLKKKKKLDLEMFTKRPDGVCTSLNGVWV